MGCRGTIVIWMLVLLGCGSADMKAFDTAPAAFNAEGEKVANAPVGEPAPQAPEGAGDLSIERKIVYTANVELVVEDFAVLEKGLFELIKQFDGYVAGSNIHVAHRDRREGTWTIRIPIKNFDDFLVDAKKLGELRSTGISSEDRTEEYYDVKAALENKNKTLERFKKLADTHEGDLKHIRELEKEIERVQGEIDRLTGRIRLLDNLTSLTTVTLTAIEIKDYVPPESPTFVTEITRSFSQSISSLTFAGRQFVIFAVAAAPWLAILLIVLLLLRLVWRRWRRSGAT